MTRNQFDAFGFTSELRDEAVQSKAWPFEEARKLIKRYEKTGYPETVLFETGYGPSGLPHIGTFGEVARTTMVRHAFHVLTEDKIKTKLICFSDDMDGLRKVPENVPDREKMANYLGQPLSRVPNPFEDASPSFGAANNMRLCAFLDRFGFDYEFASATDYYSSGRFDEVLLKILASYDEVMKIVLPTLGEERQETYALFLPISPVSGKVLQVPIIDRNVKKGTVTYIEPETGETVETEVTGGKVKCQWKVDWAMRWKALGVDYEMAGKDLIDSVNLSSKICKMLGSNPPEGFNYELFLDEKGQKISKSKGNGLTIDEWLTYAPTESLGLYMFLKPKTAKRLYFDVIPKAVDEYYAHLSAYGRQQWKERLSNPVYHIHSGCPPQVDMPVSFAMLLNLVSASNAENEDVLWGFISRYSKGTNAQTCPALDLLVKCAIKYFDVFVKPNKQFRAPDDIERAVLAQIDEKLANLPEIVDDNALQNSLLDVARLTERYQDHNKKSPEGGPGVSVAFFQMLYEVLLGQERGPRFGSFIALYGVDEMRALIAKVLSQPMGE
ncbi:lysine-tRNA ligase [Bartonella bacilliformis str. Heidi Mejia]|uniref:lysine--tRNA ligase n=1 Tax=Bartonella bacilliformis TaxID=774 RepID=UPI00044C5FF9|nr:lysine--tRNA ligase [Bartonella bacilliformis]EYS90838.1 lysine-tRNA ligase [Bartonella bacilliformis str. Heidi Mejia]KEG17153.1 lysine-tRNA ligase [Bartonella bacilliformis Hosp800-02]KEG17245.1 lysine-tRNA ligase [Bartonella bacilliformis Hosp800-02]KEG21969.1 lysine-tRNA ligase [Bartonella bacilliformis VAB9028]KEG23345.1 lysine-tRNA ligase [Bartonella bacilliformis CAR600-02]